MPGGIRTFSTPYINTVLSYYSSRGFGLAKGGRLQSSFEAQLVSVWLKWNANKRGGTEEWWGFSQCLRQQLLSIAVVQILFRAFTPFSLCCLFPTTVLPQLSMYLVYDSMHKQLVQERATGGFLMHGAASNSYQSQYRQDIIFSSSLGLQSKSGWLTQSITNSLHM